MDKERSSSVSPTDEASRTRNHQSRCQNRQWQPPRNISENRFIFIGMEGIIFLNPGQDTFLVDMN